METIQVSTSAESHPKNKLPGTPKTNRGYRSSMRYIICLRQRTRFGRCSCKTGTRHKTSFVPRHRSRTVGCQTTLCAEAQPRTSISPLLCTVR